MDEVVPSHACCFWWLSINLALTIISQSFGKARNWLVMTCHQWSMGPNYCKSPLNDIQLYIKASQLSTRRTVDATPSLYFLASTCLHIMLDSCMPNLPYTVPPNLRIVILLFNLR
jgi:hypothetical protein